MTTKIARPLLRFTVLALLAGAAAGCSTISDLDPTGLLSDDSPPTPSDQFPADASAAPPADDATTTPDLASLPSKPTTASTPAQQQQVAQQVTTAGSQAQYSADALRAGTEPAAPPPAGSQPVTVAAATPPGISDAPPTADNAPPSASAAPPSASDLPPTANDLPPTAGEAPSAAPSVAAAPVAPPPAASTNVAAVPAVPPAGGRRVRAASNAPPPVEASAAAPEAPAPSTAVASAPAPAGAATTVASAAPVPGGEPAVPAVPPGGSGTRVAMLSSASTPSDSALGFKPSTAPPLDPSISNWVSAPILAHYRQTASAADVNTVGNAAVPAAAAGRGMGGPNMSGAVVANMDALSSAAAGTIAANYSGVPPTAIVYFSGDGTTLNAQGRAKVREAAVAFKAAGGAGTVRVVGHAASRTANMSVEKHLEVIFEKSQKRADAVAQELIHDGVPADKVNIQAVGDSQPIYYESMPKGEDGNRRAEIFVQS